MIWVGLGIGIAFLIAVCYMLHRFLLFLERLEDEKGKD